MLLRIIVLVGTLSIASSASAEINVKRFFESSTSYMRVIVATDKKVQVKCIVYNSSKEPIRVSTQYISPPLDEVIIRTGSETKNSSTVSCTEM